MMEEKDSGLLIDTKTCPRCKQNLEASKFGIRSTRKKDGSIKLRPYCKQCELELNRSDYKKDKHYFKKYHLRKYGLTEKSFLEMYTNQGCKCAICKSLLPLEKMYVDHNHKSGKIRGLLCMHCNTGLGHFRDNERILINAIAYLYDDNQNISNSITTDVQTGN